MGNLHWSCLLNWRQYWCPFKCDTIWPKGCIALCHLLWRRANTLDRPPRPRTLCSLSCCSSLRMSSCARCRLVCLVFSSAVLLSRSFLVTFSSFSSFSFFLDSRWASLLRTWMSSLSCREKNRASDKDNTQMDHQQNNYCSNDKVYVQQQLQLQQRQQQYQNTWHWFLYLSNLHFCLCSVLFGFLLFAGRLGQFIPQLNSNTNGEKTLSHWLVQWILLISCNSIRRSDRWVLVNVTY